MTDDFTPGSENHPPSDEEKLLEDIFGPVKHWSADKFLTTAYVQLSDHVYAVDESGHAEDCDDCKSLLKAINAYFERKAEDD